VRSRLGRLLGAAARASDGRLTLLAAVSIIATSAVIGTAYGSSSLDPALAQALARLFAGGGGADATTTASTPGSSPFASIPPAPPSSGSPAPAPAQTAPTRTVTTVTKAPPPTTTTTPTQTTPPPSTTTTTPAPTTPVKHVFVISLASPGYDAAFGAEPQMPYLSGTLRPKGELLSDYSLLTQTDLPNYIAMISGQPPNRDTKAGCPKFVELKGAPDSSGIVHGNGCVYTNEALTLPDQMVVGGYFWRAYVEGMGDANGAGNCIHPDSGASDQTEENSPGGLYTDRHNPFVYFHSLLDLGGCFSNDMPMDQLGADLKKTTSTANLSFISPDLCNSGATDPCPDGSAGGAAAEDAFLKQWVPQILKSPAYKNDGLLIVTFGENGPSNASDNAVGTLVVSKFVTPGGTLVEPYGPYSLLASIEDFFGLGHLAMANDSSTSSFAQSVLGGGD
jgi:hypothetical protein